MTRENNHSGPGRPPDCPHDVAELVVLLEQQGLSLAKIADTLNATGTPTPRGRPHWEKSHVNDLLATSHVQKIRDELKDA